MGIEKQQVNQVCLATNFCEIACVGKDYLKFWKKNIRANYCLRPCQFYLQNLQKKW